VRIIFVDYLSPKGHVMSIKKMIDIISKKYDIVFISSEKMCSKIERCEVTCIDNKYFEYNNRYMYIIGQILLSFKIRKIIKNIIGYNDRILVFGFENIVMCLFSYFMPSLHLFIHNNLEKNYYSDIALKLISKNMSFIVYEEYIMDYIEKKYKIKTYSLPHTINFDYNDSVKITGGYIYVPGYKKDLFPIKNELLDIINKNNLLLYAHFDKNEKINNKNIICLSYAEDYYEMIKNAKYIYIPSKYDYRVNGAFYDSMMYNKIIIVDRSCGLFLKKMKNKYKYSVFYADEYPFKISDIEKKNEYEKYLNEHGDKNILKKLINLMN
jgi:hypothetical protein